MRDEDIYCIATENPMALKYYLNFIGDMKPFDPISYIIQNGKKTFLLCVPLVRRKDLIRYLRENEITIKDFGCFDKDDIIFRLTEESIDDEINIEQIRVSELEDMSLKIPASPSEGE